MQSGKSTISRASTESKSMRKIIGYEVNGDFKQFNPADVEKYYSLAVVGMIDSAETIYETADGYVLLKHEQFTDGGLATVLSAKESIRWFLSNGIVPPLNALTTEKNGTKEEPTWEA